MLLDEVAPLVDRQVEETRKLLDLGEVDVLVLRVALTTALDTKLEVLDATGAEAVESDALMSLVRPRWVSRPQSRDEDDIP
jgi:hypothetical protein